MSRRPRLSGRYCSRGLNSDFDSQVVIDVTVEGMYRIEARSYGDSGEGDYNLTIETN